MNKLILALSALVIIGASCNKRDAYRRDAQVIGYDFTKCGCCGGFMVKLADEEDANKYYLADSLPASSGINKYSTFPISVEVDYKVLEESCEDKFIEVTRIRLK
jgi:hypothetical protein